MKDKAFKWIVTIMLGVVALSSCLGMVNQNKEAEDDTKDTGTNTEQAQVVE